MGEDASDTRSRQPRSSSEARQRLGGYLRSPVTTDRTWSSEEVDGLARQLGADSIRATTAAGSGHPTSSLSAAHLLATLLTRHLRFSLDNGIHSDRLVLSKGHAAPLLYAALSALGVIPAAQLTELRQEGSPLEGHPVPGRLPLVDAATGSLGQGLSIGLGMALGLRRIGSDGQAWVILGDSEMTEGSVWEAMELAREYGLGNLRAVLDMNRLGQTGPTMAGWDSGHYASRAEAFGWTVAEVDGHDPDSITGGIQKLESEPGPGFLVARTVKGHGVSFLADLPGKHGTALSAGDADRAIAELDPPERITVPTRRPDSSGPAPSTTTIESSRMSIDPESSTRAAFGESLADAVRRRDHVYVLDAEVGNSTKTGEVEDTSPDRFFQMYIAEQAMVGAAVGLQAVGLWPVVSTFAAFLTRAHDFLRMAAISRARMLVNGSHAGVSIGEDGPSQMGLEDLAMMRGLTGSTVLYPADATATWRLVELGLENAGITYIRTTRESTPPIYTSDEEFRIGGSAVPRPFSGATATVVAAGITVHEALTAADELDRKGTVIGVIDAYSIQPIDRQTIRAALESTGTLIVVEDHGPVGGLGDAVLDATSDMPGTIVKLAVRDIPGSAAPTRQREIHGIASSSIIDTVEGLAT